MRAHGTIISCLLLTCGATPQSTSEWKLNPIKMDGQYLVDSVTNKPFNMVGIGFPNALGDEAEVYVTILKNIGEQGKGAINTIRMYELPNCIWRDYPYATCMQEFFKTADSLGIYVLLPGTGAQAGYIPSIGWKDLQDLYSQGKVLDRGRQTVNMFSKYPNALGIFLGNEFLLTPSNYPGLAVFKAYARDMKAYMKMCNEDDASPSKGKMRQIPLFYAARDFGDKIVSQEMDYLMCDSANVSLDVYGLNVERWCDPATTDGYVLIEKWLTEHNNPGAFMFSEMGCPQNIVSHAPPGQQCFNIGPPSMRVCPRNWNQVPDFFTKHPMMSGFSAYAYWNSGAQNFNMVDSNKPDAKLLDDGANFFAQAQNVTLPTRNTSELKWRPCAASLEDRPLLDYNAAKVYNEEGFPPAQCPATAPAEVVIV